MNVVALSELEPPLHMVAWNRFLWLAGLLVVQSLSSFVLEVCSAVIVALLLWLHSVSES